MENCSKATINCSIKTCTNNYSNNMNVTYHRFPLKYLYYLQWVQAIPKNLLDLPIQKYTYICSMHFCLDSYESSQFISPMQNKLRKYAYPTIFNRENNYEDETEENKAKSPQRKEKETLLQTKDMSANMTAQISAENIEELEKESLLQGTEYVKKCLHPRDQTTQTNILEPYDLDVYDIIIEKDETQPDQESDNNLREIMITKDEIQPVTGLGNNLYEIMTTNKITKLTKNEIQSVKESESPFLFHNNTCHVTGQAMQVFPDSLEKQGLPYNGAYQVTEQTAQVFSDSSKKVESLLLLCNNTWPVIKLPVVESPLLLYNGACLVTGQAMQEYSNCLQQKESPMLLHYGTCQVTTQAIPGSSNFLHKKESPILLPLSTCQVTGQAMQVSSDALQEKESPMLLHSDTNQLTEQAVQEPADSLQKEESPLLLHHGTYQVTEEAMRESSDSIQKKESPTLLPLDASQVIGQDMQESSDSLQERESPMLLSNDLCEVTEESVRKSSDSLEKKVESPVLLFDGLCEVTEAMIREESSDCLEEIGSSMLLLDNPYEVSKGAVQKFSDSLVKKESPLVLFDDLCEITEETPWMLHKDRTHEVTEWIVQKFSDSLQKKEIIKLNYEFLNLAHPLLLNNDTCHMTEQTVQKSFNSLEKKGIGQAVQKSFNSLEKKESPLLLHNDTYSIIDLIEKGISKSRKKGSSPRLYDVTNHAVTSDVTKQTVPEASDSQKKDDVIWLDEVVFALLDAYKRHKRVIGFERATRNIWSLIASMLAKKGYNPTAVQCKHKMKELRYMYHRTLKGHDPKWKFFNIMRELLGKSLFTPITSRSSNSDLSLLEPDIDNDKLQPQITTTPHSTLDIPFHDPPLKRLKQIEDDNLKYSMEKIVNIMEKKIIERKKIHEEAMARQDKLLEALDKIVNNFTGSNRSCKTGCTSTDKCHSLEESERGNLGNTLKKIISIVEENTNDRTKMYETTVVRQDKLLHILENKFNKF